MPSPGTAHMRINMCRTFLLWCQCCEYDLYWPSCSWMNYTFLESFSFKKMYKNVSITVNAHCNRRWNIPFCDVLPPSTCVLNWNFIFNLEIHLKLQIVITYLPCAVHVTQFRIREKFSLKIGAIDGNGDIDARSKLSTEFMNDSFILKICFL